MNARSAGCTGLAVTLTSTLPGGIGGGAISPRMSACSGSPALSKRMAFIFLVLSLDVWQRSAMFAWLATAQKPLHP
jgi:hypothetical protein